MASIIRKQVSNGDRIEIGDEAGIIIDSEEELHSLDLVLPRDPADLRQLTVYSRKGISNLRIYGGICPSTPKAMQKWSNFTLMHDRGVWVMWQSRGVRSFESAVLSAILLLALISVWKSGLGEILTALLSFNK